PSDCITRRSHTSPLFPYTTLFRSMMNQINTSNNGQYYYLCDRNGEIIYHPRQIQISDGISNENSGTVSEYKDGIYNETFEGQSRDRKSTRLNSSHVSISYAVFCLK